MTLEIVGQFLTVLGLILAIWQTWEASRQAKHLDVIRGSLSTRYLGQFPDFVPSIIDMLNGARKSIVIVCDFPCYSHFSAHHYWIDYKAAIERAASTQKKVSIAFPNSSRRREIAREQFRFSAISPEQWKSDPRIRSLLGGFLSRRHSTLTADSITFQQFEDAIEATNESAIEHSFEGVVLKQNPDPVTIYFWIVDESQAIFSIPSASGHDREQGFITSDTKLISALLKIAEKIHKA